MAFVITATVVQKHEARVETIDEANEWLARSGLPPALIKGLRIENHRTTWCRSTEAEHEAASVRWVPD